MSDRPIPVVFHPIFKPKPWGGRRLATLFDKPLPGHDPIGESWELVSLPGHESHVRGGPLAEQTLGELVDQWGEDLLGSAQLADGRFPLLIKFLDACEHLSVQVHPKPAAGDTTWQPGIKHEAWYVLHAEPDAKLFIGLKEGVQPEDVARVANTPAMVDLLHEWAGEPGQCYYLPSGTLHALGAGLVVAEVQTPSDVTYRAYDWNRVGLDGKPRNLHIDQSLANIRYDVTDDMIVQPAGEVVGPAGSATRVASCERFAMDVHQGPTGLDASLPAGQMRVWMVLSGAGRLTTGDAILRFGGGDVVLIPAASDDTHVKLDATCKWMETTIPAPDA